MGEHVGRSRRRRATDPHKADPGTGVHAQRAGVELHRGSVDGSLALVDEAMEITDADFGPDEQLLHRSVLLYNRAQVRGARRPRRLAGRLRRVIRRDPDYGDYYFEARPPSTGRSAGTQGGARGLRGGDPAHAAVLRGALQPGRPAARTRRRGGRVARSGPRALDLEPDHVESLVHRADLLLRAARSTGPPPTSSTASPSPRTTRDSGRRRGRCSPELGDVEAAYESYSTALHADPTCVAAWANRAVLAFEAGRTEDAVGDLDAALALVGDPGAAGQPGGGAAGPGRAPAGRGRSGPGAGRRGSEPIPEPLYLRAPAASPSGTRRARWRTGGARISPRSAPDDVSPHAERDRSAGRDAPCGSAGVSGRLRRRGPVRPERPIWCAPCRCPARAKGVAVVTVGERLVGFLRATSLVSLSLGRRADVVLVGRAAVRVVDGGGGTRPG
ncbi:tetratricopeptide repeat protein [Streptomyces sp. KL116D]|uniref:tetratricopeptide repeat protein n=1 Tax=Streptomyces sp. KL116D TaxID=3045152 RepID=UPI0035578142